ncbi:catechol 2,3-dioxygenase-like lactoylglutathione lyase family enzyme [Alkalihalobacillus xiaoxiensis]|uniref:Catechol 2,3-dioxygenase-like lactoylglutathione lyase family enzyme n=1 Tax=Shouchella xiaoxiensis TaxID=766895 RepID=A0ABS2STM4_9BACI|nr:VOC family protein [Shouchella xiaoxiensis]MBM7838879.1 catechol 2,3-dioxygenase-like lactoylglutathione lyase family enzyme [Shouchella xiaoxiensis]
MFRIGSVFIPVTNLEKSKKWYEKHLHVTFIDRWEGGAGFYFAGSRTQLGLVQVKSPQPAEFVIQGKQKNVYFNFVVDNIDEAHHRLQQAGVAVTPNDDFGGMKGFDCFDLDQNVLSIVSEEIDSPFHSAHIQKAQDENK